MKTNLLILPFFLFSTFINAQHWEEISADVFPDFHRVWSLKMVNDQTIWACSSSDFGGPILDPQVSKSLDGGITWSAFPISMANGFTAWDIAPVDAQIAYLSAGSIYKTMDGGASWTPITTYQDFPVYLHFFNQNEGWVAGATGSGLRMATTNDGGQSWEYAEESSIIPWIGYSTYNASYDVEDDMIGMSMRNGTLWVSYDKGHTFEEITTPMSSLNQAASVVAIKDGTSFMVAGDGTTSDFFPVDPFSYYTEDGGNSWLAGDPTTNTATGEYLEVEEDVFLLSGQYFDFEGTELSNTQGQNWSYTDNTRIISTDFSDTGFGIGVFGNIGPFFSDLSFKEDGKVYRWNYDPCYYVGFPNQVDSDCDNIIDGSDCDVCAGVDDTVDNNGDGLPDCAYPPNYEDIIDDWKCGNNKVFMTVNPNNPHTICVNKNAINAHINNGGYLGSYGSANCDEEEAKTNDQEKSQVVERSTRAFFPIAKNPFIHTTLKEELPANTLQATIPIEVFPNPTSEILHIDLNGYYGNSAKFEIVDNLGRVFYSQNISEITTNITEVSVEEIPVGFYRVIFLINNEIRITKPFVVSR